MLIGGEYVFSFKVFFKKKNSYLHDVISNCAIDYKINYTFGGYYSLLAIIDFLWAGSKNDLVILLPSYLCPSILKPFKLRGVKYKFYKVDSDLYVDNHHLLSMIDDTVKAVYFIDYFGISQLEHLQPTLINLKQRNIVIIQDVVQCLDINKDKMFGDYIFNSFRKFFPYEGSLLLSRDKIDIKYSSKRNPYIKYKRIGQIMRYFHLKFGVFSSKFFLKFLQKAEKRYYDNEIFKMPNINLRELKKYDLRAMLQGQMLYYGQLVEVLNKYAPKLLKSGEGIPLGFIVITDRRDDLRRFLFSQNVFAPIHWLLPDELDENIFLDSKKMSQSILTIPLIGLDENRFKFLYEVINKYFKYESIP
jgi:hypothetical protein